MTYRHNNQLLPEPFGLPNYGANCYFNSLMQSLISCTAFNEAVIGNPIYMQRTNTGQAVYDFVKNALKYQNNNNRPTNSTQSIYGALTRDLRQRRPFITFGPGQQSASECFILLLDMIEPELTPEELQSQRDNNNIPADGLNPVTDIFIHIKNTKIFCQNCNHEINTRTHETQFNLMDFNKNSQEDEFIPKIHMDQIFLEEYICDNCKVESSHENRIIKTTILDVVPEIFVCLFDIYEYYAHSQRFVRQMPEYFEFQTPTNEILRYRRVAQVEHSGSRAGGHYWAICLRKKNENDESPFLLNDSNASPHANLNLTRDTYLAFYQLLP